MSARADISANAGDTYLVTYTLDGMVFRTVASIRRFCLRLTSPSLRAGSLETRMVVFRMDGADIRTAVLTTTPHCSETPRFAISAAGSGSVTRTVTNQSLAILGIPGVSGTMTHTASGVIKLGSGLKETSMAMSPTATVVHSFRSFGGSAVATVGSLQVTHNEMVRQNDARRRPSHMNSCQIIDHADGRGDEHRRYHGRFLLRDQCVPAWRQRLQRRPPAR